ncbi:hypothetical protein ILYODFUR_017411 [Ilyodon furcidens]|uniref:Uncharacterized protein n=1 Tax=Ilyodon furcidens TaxID=33524 RepID=A0ABV0UTZ3_9TELE
MMQLLDENLKIAVLNFYFLQILCTKHMLVHINVSRCNNISGLGNHFFVVSYHFYKSHTSCSQFSPALCRHQHFTKKKLGEAPHYEKGSPSFHVFSKSFLL